MITRFDIDTLPAVPWKNGGGVTRELAVWPPGAGLEDFDWRVSIARIAANGPFSTFAGVERSIMLLDGAGVELQSDARNHRLDLPYEPFAFSGELPVQCVLLPGARESTDFNVMSRSSRCSAAVQVFEQASKLAPATHGLLLCATGQWHIGGGTLKRGQGVWWAEQSERWRIKPASRDARLVAVGWSFVGEAAPAPTNTLITAPTRSPLTGP